MYPNATIPEKWFVEEGLYDDDVAEWTLDLSGDAESADLTSQLQQTKYPVQYRAFQPSSSTPTASALEEAERDCGICLGLAIAQVTSLCCGHFAELFCSEEMAAWAHDPSSDGVSTEWRTAAYEKDLGLLELAHPDFLPLVPSTPSLSGSCPPSPTPSLSSCSESGSDCSSASTPSYTSYPSLMSLSESEDDAEDVPVSLPALVHVRALQTRRRAPHPVSSVLGARGALESVARIGLCLVAAAVVVGAVGY
ncbi:hypothetical protein FB451DRAFT_69371 [Mycena latifolia]|nr:hypothetical protein FB451DRAFT_69371 [Mycena latifolia]